MKYHLVYTQRAVRDISGFNSSTRDRIRKGLEKYAESPLTYARKMVDSAVGTYRFRIGQYRIIFDLDGDKIVILRAGHRRELYRKR